MMWHAKYAFKFARICESARMYEAIDPGSKTDYVANKCCWSPVDPTLGFDSMLCGMRERHREKRERREKEKEKRERERERRERDREEIKRY
jgi:hypothetical protein